MQAAGKAADLQCIDPHQFRDELELVGCVAPAGRDERGYQCWSLAHRTVYKFLAARALSLPEDGWLYETKQHLWFKPEWLEVPTFLAALVADVTPLIAAIEEERKEDDLFGSMPYLQAQLCGAAAKVDSTTLDRAAQVPRVESNLHASREFRPKTICVFSLWYSEGAAEHLGK